jgi:hypothetical protein
MSFQTFKTQLAKSFSTDRKHTPESVEVAADSIRELVRYLNHALYGGQRVMPLASDGYAVLGSLQAAGLSQLCRQLMDWATEVQQDPSLRSTHGEGKAAGEAQAAAYWLSEAARGASLLTDALGKAQQQLSPLWHDIPEEQA